MSVAKNGIRVVDIDSHVYEPKDIWDRYIPAEDRAVARSAFFHGLDDEGNAVTVLNGKPAHELNRTKIVRQAIWRPGMTPEQIGALDPEAAHPLNLGAWDPTQRVTDLDALGIDRQVLFPTLFAEYFPIVENPEAAAILARAYNDWVLDFCAAAPERFTPVAVLPLQSLLHARRELDRVAERGFRHVFLRPMFYSGPVTEARGVRAQLQRAMLQAAGGVVLTNNARGVFVDHPHFQPLWRHLVELGLVACFHPSTGSTNPEATSSGTFVERVARNMGIGHNVAESVAYMQDLGILLIALFFHGVLEDYPTLRIALVHGGATMVPLALEKAETYLWLAFSNIFGIDKPVSLEPHDVFRDQPVVVSFDGWERPVARMADALFETKAAWGSRYPHHDTSTPAEAIGMLESESLPKKTIERMMGGNASEVLRLEEPVPA